MKSYKVKINRKAVSYLRRLEKRQQERVKRKLSLLQDGKFEELKVIKMAGEWEGYMRFRIGKYRVIFRLEKDTIYVDYIGARGDVYK